jgi:hypothetical protein
LVVVAPNCRSVLAIGQSGAVSREGWLKRWDRHNQTVLGSTETIPDEIRLRWKWDRQRDENGREMLVIGRVTLSEEGVSSRLFWRRFWPWDRVAYLSWQMVKYNGVLAVCARGDSYTHSLNFGHRDPRVCRVLLDDCREFVEAHSARVSKRC